MIEFWHADNDRIVIVPTLEMFFRQIIQFYETKHKEEYDEYFEVEEIENYPIKFILE